MKAREIISRHKKDKEWLDLDFIRKDSYFRIFLYFVDLILLTLAFLYLGLGGSSFINAFITQPAEPTKSKWLQLGEVTWESLLLIFLLYFLVWIIPYIPSIVPYPDINHGKFRRTAQLVVVAAVVFAHERLLFKIHEFIGVDN